MSPFESRRFEVHVKGPLACFTRPEMKVERVSYEVMTPSAARGVFDAVLWKPAIKWQIHAIAVLQPIAWTSFRRNEIASRQTRPRDDYFADEDRAQRNTVALKDVEYVVSASFVLTEHAGPEDNVRKFEDMFARRLRKGNTFTLPIWAVASLPLKWGQPQLGISPSSRESVDRSEECCSTWSLSPLPARRVRIFLKLG